VKNPYFISRAPNYLKAANHNRVAEAGAVEPLAQ
jgi:hypothetical protein